MSSHHVIRENQEPALLILHAQALSFEKIQELLEWSPTVIALSTEVHTVISWGIKVDVVIAPFAEIENLRNELIDQVPIRILSFQSGEDPLMTAFYFLHASKTTAVNCLIRSLDDLKKMDTTLTIDMEAFLENVRWVKIRSGVFKKWVAEQTTLFVWPDSVQKEFPTFTNGSLVTAQDGIITLTSANFFWVGEQLS